MDISEELRGYTLPENVKPFVKERQPFLKLSKRTLNRSISLFYEFPRKRGIISDAIRELTGEELSYPEKFVRFEAHFNIDEVDQEVENEIVFHGFEPDDFVELHPPQYKRNFTFAYDADNPVEERLRSEYLKNTCEALMESLSDKHSGFHFVEAERFASTHIRKFNGGEVKPARLTIPPYRVVEVPCRDGEANEYGFTPETRKAIDVHIKIKGIVHPDPNYRASSVIGNRRELAAALASLGLYRITSVSGNTIYTAQFHDGEKARTFIKAITEFLDSTGLAESIISEPCFLFLRSKSGSQYAPVCHLLE